MTIPLAETRNAEDKDHAQAAASVFAADYGTGWPKAAAKITGNLEVLLAFHDYPRRALDTTCAPPTRSGPPSPPCFASEAVSATRLVPLVRSGAVFKNGKLITA